MKKFCPTCDSSFNTDEKIFLFKYEYICSFLAEEIMLEKENYFLNEFSEIFDRMIFLYIPKNLALEFTNDEINKIKKTAFKDFSILIDSNNYANTLAQEQRILIQFFIYILFFLFTSFLDM